MKASAKWTISLLVALLFVFLTVGIGVSAATETGTLFDTFKTKSNTNNLNTMGIVHPMDPVIGTCNIPWRKSSTGFVQFTSQVSSTPSFSWGLQLTKPGVTAIGNPTTVSLINAYIMLSGSSKVRTLYPGSLYGPHREYYPYIFHGSFSTYNYVGSSTKAQLKHGDILDLKFMIDGARGTDFTFIECRVP